MASMGEEALVDLTDARVKGFKHLDFSGHIFFTDSFLIWEIKRGSRYPVYRY